MKYLLSMSLLAAMFMLTGCPAQTENAMDPTGEVPAWLEGNWCKKGGKGEKGDCYRLKKSDKEGIMTRYEIEGGRYLVMSGQNVVISRIGASIFAFAYEMGDGFSTADGYYIFEVRKQSENEIVLAGIKESKISYSMSKEDIRAYLQTHRHDTDLYDQYETATYLKQ